MGTRAIKIYDDRESDTDTSSRHIDDKDTKGGTPTPSDGKKLETSVTVCISSPDAEACVQSGTEDEQIRVLMRVFRRALWYSLILTAIVAIIGEQLVPHLTKY